MSVDAHARRRDVGGDSEIRQPQVLYVRFTERALDCLIEIPAAEHRCHRISEIQDLTPPLCHFL